jgi:L-arabinonolactonase
VSTKKKRMVAKRDETEMPFAEIVLDCCNQHGEGVLWNAADERVWWTDIQGRSLWWYAPDSGQGEAIPMPDRVCCFAPRRRGGFILGLADRVAFFDVASRSLETIAMYEPDNPETRLNDGRTDRQGRLVAGGMNEKTGAADASVIRVDANGNATTLLQGISCANSICFSPDGETMFFTDTPERLIRAYDYSGVSGGLGAMRVHCDVSREPGVPDGSCVDAEGGVWNAEWEGHRVVRIAPDGRIDTVINVPVWKPTCCAFGGVNLETLFITTSRLGSSDEQLIAEPLSGGLFAVKPSFRGIADLPFAG